MSKAVAVCLCAIALVDQAAACSLSGNRMFKHGRLHQSTDMTVPRYSVESVVFNPRFGGSSSCEDLGWVSIKLKAAEAGSFRLRRMGFLVRSIDDRPSPAILPEAALAAFVEDRDTVSVSFGLSHAKPDTDGHYRWRLALVPVARDGAMAQEVEVCLATDDSCDDVDLAAKAAEKSP